MPTVTFASVVSAFGAEAKAKLDNPAISGAPEDQLRAPLERLFHELAALGGLAPAGLSLVGETTLSQMLTRPDYAVIVDNALVGFIEVKAPGKGCDPRRFADSHDKGQWGKLKSLPNLVYTDGNGFSLWRDGELEGKIVLLEGDIETSGAKLKAPESLRALLADFLGWAPQPPTSARALAQTSARLCRLLRDEVLEEMAAGHGSLRGLKQDWRKLLFPEATDEQFADGYAQAVTFGLLMAKAFDISLKDGVELAAIRLRRTNTLIGTALNLLTQDEANQQSLKTSLGTLTRVLDEVNWATLSKDKPEAWLYFYEHFLEVYDNRLRKLTGSYYTPPEVVEAMVNLVDQALRGPLFERAAGLASSDVTLADPAVGTGTFLLGALAENRRQCRKGSGRGHGSGGDRRRRETAVRLRTPVRPVRRRAIAPAGRNAIPDQDGRATGPARTQSLHHRHARQSLRRGGAIAADRRGHRQIAARGEQGQARSADHRRHRQSAVQGKGAGARRLDREWRRRQAARAARPLEGAG